MARADQPWQALLDSAGEGIWGVDLEGNCTFVNRAALRMLEFDSTDLIGHNMHRMVHHHHPDGRDYPGEDCTVYSVFQEGEPFTNRVDHLFRKDGSMFWAELSAQPIVDKGTVLGAVVTFRDITRARLTEEALRRSDKLAALGQLTSSIAHEINNPLEAVTNLLYLVRTSQDPEAMRTYAALAEVELARVTEITHQTLLFHRRGSSIAATDVAALLRAVTKLHSSRMEPRGVTLHLDLRPCPEALLIEGELRQVLNNLIRNAYEAMPHGGPLRIRLRPGSCHETPGLRLTIADSGTGLHPSIRVHLWQPFRTTKENTGTGLGLWITRGVVEKNGGRIAVRSRHYTECRAPQRSGTVFHLWMPLEPGPESHASVRHAPTYPAS